ncbi:MAG: hypothetical protein HOO06_10575 [Bdellovibrionaceae bacterium]|jgi:hypothetical protein|nr:hypothetical protein [Pseudobdellovibrionaceae bacterium]
MNIKLSLFTLFLTLSTIACENKKVSLSHLDNNDLVKYNLDIQIATNKTTPQQIFRLVQRINLGQPVSFKSLTDMIISDHLKAYNTQENQNLSLTEIDKSLDTLVASINEKSDLGQEKLSYEDKLVKLSKTKKLMYNKAKVSLVHPIKQGLQQCYSGSILNLVLHRKQHSGKEFRTKNYVMIFTSGHVLPGQMIKEKGEWILMGLETTSSGKAYTKINSAKMLNSDIHVIDADMVSLLEVLKKHITAKSSGHLAWSIRKKSAKKYGISIPKFQPAYSASTGSQQSPLSSKKDSLNSMPFGFGVAKVEEGNLDRKPFSGIGSQSLTHRNENVNSKNHILVTDNPSKNENKNKEISDPNDHKLAEVPFLNQSPKEVLDEQPHEISEERQIINKHLSNLDGVCAPLYIDQVPEKRVMLPLFTNKSDVKKIIKMGKENYRSTYFSMMKKIDRLEESLPRSSVSPIFPTALKFTKGSLAFNIRKISLSDTNDWQEPSIEPAKNLTQMYSHNASYDHYFLDIPGTKVSFYFVSGFIDESKLFFGSSVFLARRLKIDTELTFDHSFSNNKEDAETIHVGPHTYYEIVHYQCKKEEIVTGP